MRDAGRIDRREAGRERSRLPWLLSRVLKGSVPTLATLQSACCLLAVELLAGVERPNDARTLGPCRGALTHQGVDERGAGCRVSVPRHVEQRDRGCGEGRGLAPGRRQHSGGSSSGGRQSQGDAPAIHAVRGLVSAAADAKYSRVPSRVSSCKRNLERKPREKPRGFQSCAVFLCRNRVLCLFFWSQFFTFFTPAQKSLQQGWHVSAQ